MIRVLALCSFPVEAAATRFRLDQFVEPLRDRGLDVTVRPFLTSDQFRTLYRGGGSASKIAAMAVSALRRVGDVIRAGDFDLVFVQREAMIFGPALVEWLLTSVRGLPMVLDLDDATYVRYVSPTYGRLGSWLKFFGKTDSLIKHSDVVICGNPFIAERVEELGTRSVIVPTVVDLDQFTPRHAKNDDANDHPTLGWIGTHSTFPFLESIFPVLEDLAEKHSFKLKIVGAGKAAVKVTGVAVENLDWDLDREPADFSGLDIGLYPITTSASADVEWIKGKSGFKAVQYLSVGVPFVMSPVGVCADIGQPSVTHFNAVTNEDWYNSLNTLLSDKGLRARMGAAGRAFALANYRIEDQAELLATTFREVVERRINKR